MFTDIFNDDAFSLEELTATINNIDHVPGRAGELCFVGAGEGVSTLTVAIEQSDEALTLIPTSPRGAPAPRERRDKAKLVPVGIPQVKLEETIGAASIQGVRQFGTTDQLLGPQTVINQQMNKMSRRHDLTLEHLRLGALQGQILDADGSVLVDLYDTFGVTEETPISLGLEDPTADQTSIRVKCNQIVRVMTRAAKMVIPAGAQIWAFCGDDFFDALLEHPSVKGVWDGWAAAERRLGDNYAFSVWEFGGIMWENYRGTDDAADNPTDPTVGIATNEARLFLTGVPGLYAEYFAPADFMETVNTIGLPRYAKVAPDQRFNQFVELHTQQNPLPICLRPRTLLTATF